MEKDKILARLTILFKEILDNEEIELSDSTTAMDIEEWDSLSHIQLIVAIEKDFAIKFTSAEIGGFKNVGEMIKTISDRLSV